MIVVVAAESPSSPLSMGSPSPDPDLTSTSLSAPDRDREVSALPSASISLAASSVAVSGSRPSVSAVAPMSLTTALPPPAVVKLEADGQTLQQVGFRAIAAEKEQKKYDTTETFAFSLIVQRQGAIVFQTMLSYHVVHPPKRVRKRKDKDKARRRDKKESSSSDSEHEKESPSDKNKGGGSGGGGRGKKRRASQELSAPSGRAVGGARKRDTGESNPKQSQSAVQSSSMEREKSEISSTRFDFSRTQSQYREHDTVQEEADENEEESEQEQEHEQEQEQEPEQEPAGSQSRAPLRESKAPSALSEREMSSALAAQAEVAVDINSPPGMLFVRCFRCLVFECAVMQR